MKRKLDKKLFAEALAKVEKNVVLDLDEYYSDPASWEEDFESTIEVAIFWGDAFNAWLRAVMFFNYPREPFAQNFLKPNTSLYFTEDNNYTLENCMNLTNYFLECAAVALINEDEDSFLKLLHESRKYHLEQLKKGEYLAAEESVAASEVNADSGVSIFVPQLLLHTFLNQNYSEVIKQIDLKKVAQDKIWVYTIHLIDTLKSDDHDQLNAHWEDIKSEWRYHFSHFQHSFHTYNLVLIYHLYCKALGKAFSLESLGAELLDI